MHIPMVDEHDSWISFDPILGCPLSCDYCYLGSHNLRRTRPGVRTSPADAVSKLESVLGERTDRTPIALGNYTDLGLRVNWAYTVKILDAIEARGIDRPVVVVTKSRDIDGLLIRLANNSLDIRFFLSQSYSSQVNARLETPDTANHLETLRNAERCSTHGRIAIHFWRPFISALNPLTTLDSRVRDLSDSGMSGSVIVGYKNLGPWATPWSPLTSALLTKQDLRLPGDEHLAMQRWRELTLVAGHFKYPVWRNTSCSMSAVSKSPDYLYTYASSWKNHYCGSTTCPSSQRRRCLESEPASAVPVEVSVGACQDQDLLTQTHLRGRRSVALQVNPSKAWRGVVVAGTEPRIAELIPYSLRGNPALYAAAHRLRGVTGFVTVLPDTDARTAAFNRFSHVERVMEVTRRITVGCPEPVQQRALEVAFLHDLARLPFAHNLEKSRGFNQAYASASFYTDAVGADSTMITDLTAFHDRDWANMSQGASAALTADMVSGLIEDPLLLVTGLRVDPGFIPEQVMHDLCLPLASEDRSQLAEISSVLHNEQDVARFEDAFNVLFNRTVDRLVEQMSMSGDLASAARTITGRHKEPFLRNKIFPLNNELVSHGALLAEVTRIHLERNPDAEARLSYVTDAEMASGIVGESSSQYRMSDLAPSLDAVPLHRPEIAFHY